MNLASFLGGLGWGELEETGGREEFEGENVELEGILETSPLCCFTTGVTEAQKG